MTYNEFITAIETYYGQKYESKLELQFLQVYLRPRNLEWLFGEVIKTHSKKWKSLPDISIFNTIETSARDQRAENDAISAWNQLLRISAGDDVLIQDTYVYQVVAPYGSWWRFCEERDNNREWTRKDFVRRYKSVIESGVKTPPRPLDGELRKSLGHTAIGIMTRKLCESNIEIEDQSNIPDGLLDFVKRV